MKHNWINPCLKSRKELEAKDGERRYCDGTCMWCDGGLEVCDVCGSFEGATTTHCPGADMDRLTRDKVYVTDMDFVNGAWCRNPRKRGLTSCFEEVRKHYRGMMEMAASRALYAGWQGLPSMEKEKMSRGW